MGRRGPLPASATTPPGLKLPPHLAVVPDRPAEETAASAGKGTKASKS